MHNESNTPKLPDMAAFWTVWLIMIGLAAMMGSCKNNTFSGDAGVGVRGPATDSARPPDTSTLQQSSSPPPASGTPVPGGSSGGGITTVDGSAKAATVPMKILYNSKESGNGGYGGGFEFTLKMSSGDEKLAARFNAGTKGTAASVPDACICGQVNNLELFITADGQKRNLQGWHSEVMTSHNAPGVGADWQIWLRSNPVKPLPVANSAVYLGGFDHPFLFGQSCGNFACDDRKWSNRDDTKVIFVCQVEQCPKGSTDFELRFNGMDP